MHNVQKFLIERHGYKPDDMVVLTDDSRNPRQIPTRANMVAAMQWLVQGARANDALFFHYSGHGGQTKDVDGDEDDGYDEVIYPVDFKTAGHIVDDEREYASPKGSPKETSEELRSGGCPAEGSLEAKSLEEPQRRPRGKGFPPWSSQRGS